jgi:hypothetical protein
LRNEELEESLLFGIHTLPNFASKGWTYKTEMIDDFPSKLGRTKPK